MKKIRLRLDALAVHSFATERAPRERGTVRGAESGSLTLSLGETEYRRCGDQDFQVSYGAGETCTCPIDRLTALNTCETCQGNLTC